MKTLELPLAQRNAMRNDSTHVVFARKDGYVAYRLGHIVGSEPLMGKDSTQIILETMHTLEGAFQLELTYEVL